MSIYFSICSSAFWFFSVKWQNKAMLCSQQGYFHSGTSLRVVSWYSSTIKNIKMKNWFLVLAWKSWKTELPAIFPVSVWAKNNNSKSLAYIIEERRDNESNACVYFMQHIHSTVTDLNANAIFHNIYIWDQRCRSHTLKWEAQYKISQARRPAVSMEGTKMWDGNVQTPFAQSTSLGVSHILFSHSAFKEMK